MMFIKINHKEGTVELPTSVYALTGLIGFTMLFGAHYYGGLRPGEGIDVYLGIPGMFLSVPSVLKLTSYLKLNPNTFSGTWIAVGIASLLPYSLTKLIFEGYSFIL